MRAHLVRCVCNNVQSPVSYISSPADPTGAWYLSPHISGLGLMSEALSPQEATAAFRAGLARPITALPANRIPVSRAYATR